jgi:hypothetical protein
MMARSSRRSRREPGALSTGGGARVPGEEDALAARIREHVDPVARRLAPQHDGLSLDHRSLVQPG